MSDNQPKAQADSKFSYEYSESLTDNTKFLAPDKSLQQNANSY